MSWAEDWQDPVMSRARQREQAEALVRGHGVTVAELFDVGESRTVAWAPPVIPRRSGVVCLLRRARTAGAIDVREPLSEYESTAAMAALGRIRAGPGRAELRRRPA